VGISTLVASGWAEGESVAWLDETGCDGSAGGFAGAV